MCALDHQALNRGLQFTILFNRCSSLPCDPAVLGSDEIDMRLFAYGYTHAALAFKHWVQLGVALSQ